LKGSNCIDADGLLDRVLPARISLIVLVNVYVLVFNLSYHLLVTPIYAFWGLGDKPVPFSYLMLSWILSILPAFWLPTTFRRPSLLPFWVLYLVIFVPSSFIVYYSDNPWLPPAKGVILVLFLFLGLSLISLGYTVPLVRLKRPRIPTRIVWSFVGAATIGLTLYLLVSHKQNLRLVSLNEIYNLRQEMAENVASTGTIFGFYAIMWLANFLLPALFAFASWFRRWWIAAAALLGQLFLYMVGGFKMTLLAIVYLPLIYLLLRRYHRNFPVAFTAGINLLLVAGFVPSVLSMESASLAMVGVIHFRIFSVPGLLLAQYYDFFQHYPLTYLSHVTGFNKLIAYPYEIDIPRLLGFHYYGAPDLGANAIFWASDGLAAFGLPGILIISLFCAAVFWLFDTCSLRHDPRLAAMCAAVITVSMSNMSLFTTLWSGGLIFLLGLLWLLPGTADSSVMEDGPISPVEEGL
jgi:hypothetical protein